MSPSPRVISTTYSLTSHRYISSLSPTHTTAELDSHADTCAVGKLAYIVNYTGQTCTVHPFVSGLKSIAEVPIVTAAIAYDCPHTLQTYILFLHQALYIPRLESHLLCPNQLRQNGITVNDIPLIHTQANERRNTDHSIVADGLHIPLHLEGVISCFDCRMPTAQEVESQANAIHIHLTNHHSWDPKDSTNSRLEQALRETVAPVRGPDIGVSEDAFLDLPAYGLSALETFGLKASEDTCPIYDIRSVAAVGTIQDLEDIRATSALDIDSYAAALSHSVYLDEVLAGLDPDDQFVDRDQRFLQASYISKKKSHLKATVMVLSPATNESLTVCPV